MSETVAYRNSLTGRIVQRPGADPMMDRSSRWQRLETTFDPSEHPVTEVNDYLASADPAERDRVLDAEAAGKARRGVLTGPYA